MTNNTLNNKFNDFPPIMNDGRNYTVYQPGAEINSSIREQSNITSNWQYRKYLQKNATNIIEKDQLNACNNVGVNLYNFSKPSPNNPYLFTSCIEDTQPIGYETSDLKHAYLSRYELQCRKSVPDVSQYKLLQMLSNS
jgi:hypothetical protein